MKKAKPKPKVSSRPSPTGSSGSGKSFTRPTKIPERVDPRTKKEEAKLRNKRVPLTVEQFRIQRRWLANIANKIAAHKVRAEAIQTEETQEHIRQHMAYTKVQLKVLKWLVGLCTIAIKAKDRAALRAVAEQLADQREELLGGD